MESLVPLNPTSVCGFDNLTADDTLVSRPIPLVARVFMLACALAFEVRIRACPLPTVFCIWVADERLEGEETEMRLGIGCPVVENTYNRVDVRTLKLAFRFTMADNRPRGIV